VNPKQFAKRIQEVGKNVVVVSDKLVAETAGLILTGVVVATPVDTGRARGNWVVSVGQPVINAINVTDKTGRGTIVRGKQVAMARVSGQTIYICNNVPYIGRLNEGYSSQAPAGFVETQIQAAVTYIRNRRIL